MVELLFSKGQDWRQVVFRCNGSLLALEHSSLLSSIVVSYLLRSLRPGPSVPVVEQHLFVPVYHDSLNETDIFQSHSFGLRSVDHNLVEQILGGRVIFSSDL